MLLPQSLFWDLGFGANHILFFIFNIGTIILRQAIKIKSLSPNTVQSSSINYFRYGLYVLTGWMLGQEEPVWDGFYYLGEEEEEEKEEKEWRISNHRLSKTSHRSTDTLLRPLSFSNVIKPVTNRFLLPEHPSGKYIEPIPEIIDTAAAVLEKEWVTASKIFNNADETTQDSKGNETQEVIKNLEADIQEILNFMASNGIVANPSKQF